MSARRLGRTWQDAGVLAAVLMVPVLHYAAVNLEDKTTVDPELWLSNLRNVYFATTLAGAGELLVAVLLIIHLAGLRRLAEATHPVLADASVAVAGLAVLGLALGSLGSTTAAYGAHENNPFEAVRPYALLGENAAAILLPSLAGTAVLIAVLSLRDRSLPRALGYVAAAFGVLLTALGIFLPGVGLLPSILWLLISTIALSVVDRRRGSPVS
jgi:hypothetical protein